jgi:hypothetical protein
MPLWIKSRVKCRFLKSLLGSLPASPALIPGAQNTAKYHTALSQPKRIG